MVNSVNEQKATIAAPYSPLMTARSVVASKIAAARPFLGRIRRRINPLRGEVARLASVSHVHNELIGAQNANLAATNKWLSSVVVAVNALSSSPISGSPDLQAAGPVPTRRDGLLDMRRQLQVWLVTTWLESREPQTEPLISVVMPTRNRADHLRRAVASVLAQRHTNFELVVVDDGSTDNTLDVLSALDNARIRVVRTGGVGQAAARNLGVDAARGSLICYLDDDNTMHPGWLSAIAWAFDRWPDTELAYGARIVEDATAQAGQPSGVLPTFEWEPFDRRRLEQFNYIDMNTIAHRAGLAGCRFDESLISCTDWDLILRVTATIEPRDIPAIACFYGAYAPNRVSDGPSRPSDHRLVRSRVHTTRPMRVLSHNAMFPLISETYILEEMLALENNGATIAFNAVHESVSPFPVAQPLWHDLAHAVQEFDPDVLFLYWATHAAGEIPELERIGRPFAVRVHSFDFDPAAVKALAQHRLCVGIWAYPHHAKAIPGAHGLVPIFTSHASLAPATFERNLAMAVSAGLPKKNFPLLFDAMDQITEYERRVVIARSNGLEGFPDEVAAMAAARANPPSVTVNAPRSEVFELLSRTSVALYSLAEDATIGMPMSLIEALYAGACVVHPDRPELRHVVGPGYRGYRTAKDIADHVREIASGGPLIDAERSKNQEWARKQFCDPDLARRFHNELSAALAAWRYAAE